VARVGDYWELAGADPAVLPIAKSTKQWKEAAFDDEDAITPRLAFAMLANGIEY